MSVAWNLRLPYLTYTRPPRRDESCKDLFTTLGKGKIVARSGKKRLICIPTYLRYFLMEPPESPPSPVIRPKTKTKGILQHQRQHRNSTGLSGPYNTTKKSHHSSTRNFFLPNQPTSRHVVQQCIPDLRQAYYKANTHIKSTHRALLGQYI